MRTRIITTMTLLCAVAVMVTAQSFESLKRSTGPSALYQSVERALNGSESVNDCKAVVAATTTFTDSYKGKTPIYLLMDYLAKHEKNDCGNAEAILDAFLENPNFDINVRYRELMPPLAYLIRENYRYLNNRFSASYISDHVLRAMIEHGANVNTYTEDGSSLMSFAVDTDNQYLQGYFVEQGINLAHRDDSGNDAVYKLIAEGRLATLRQAVEKGSVHIDIHSLKNEPTSFAKYSELYDYLAQHCASQAESYDDIVLFRQRFSNRVSLVDGNYDRLARAEANSAQTFGDIMNVVSRYPDKPDVTNPRKRAIYNKDSERLNELYRFALAVAQRPGLETLEGDGYVDEFIDVYSRYRYDPDNKVSLAKDVQAFYRVCAALRYETVTYDWNLSDNPNSGSFFRTLVGALSGGMVQLPQEDRTGRASFKQMERDRQMMSLAQEAVKHNSQYGFADYFKRAQSRVDQKQHYYKSSADVAKAAYKRYQQGLEADAAANRARNEAARQREKAIASNPDVELSSIGITYTTSDWDSDLLDKILGVNHSKREWYMKVTYSDGTEGYISKYPKDDYYQPSGGKGFFFDDKYVTLSDAIAAEYFFRKYNSTRQKGKK